MNDNQKQLRRLDKTRIRESFDAAAAHYDEAAVLQREVGERMLERLQLIRIEPQTILDVGCGTGIYSQALSRRYRKAQVFSLDLAPRMLLAARKRRHWLARHFNRQAFVCGDAECLPIAGHSVDMIFSNLALQWCDLDQVFAEFRRVLKPQGLLMFSSFGPDTLKELRHSWQAADAGDGPAVHVNDFIDMHDVGDAMLRAGLRDAVMDVENFTLTYHDAYQLMRELKAIGAHNVAHERRHSLTGKRRLQAMLAAYEKFRADGRLPATYEVIYGHAWAAASNTSQFNVTLESITTQAHKP